MTTKKDVNTIRRFEDVIPDKQMEALDIFVDYSKRLALYYEITAKTVEVNPKYVKTKKTLFGKTVILGRMDVNYGGSNKLIASLNTKEYWMKLTFNKAGSLSKLILAKSQLSSQYSNPEVLIKISDPKEIKKFEMESKLSH